MRLSNNLHLAYCTNIHRGEDWTETLAALDRDTMAVRAAVCPNEPYAIGLRLSDQASRELIEPSALKAFQKWLDDRNCYIFTINGFPYGRFHGTRVKEQVYVPDWTTNERVAYTNRLFDILSELLPRGIEGSVSTVPCSFKEFIKTQEQRRVMQANLWRTIEHIARLSDRTGRSLHLGLEPEPLCYLETSAETVAFIEEMRAERPGDERLIRHLGVNYDTCHLAVEFEDPAEAINRFLKSGVRVSKIHLSSALKVRPIPEVCRTLAAFADDVYFHQVIERGIDGSLHRYRDLDVALGAARQRGDMGNVEWRIHFHIPLHCPPQGLLTTTGDHLLGVLDLLQANPKICSHLEMETYTWEVLPPDLKNRNVVDQLVGEYRWILEQFERRNLRRIPAAGKNDPGYKNP